MSEDMEEKVRSVLTYTSKVKNYKPVPYYKPVSKVCLKALKKWKRNRRRLEQIQKNPKKFEEKNNKYQTSIYTNSSTFLIKRNVYTKLIPLSETKIDFLNFSFDLVSQKKINQKLINLLSSMNIISTSPGLIFRLFELKESNPQGVYLVWLYLNGRWEQIFLDENFPQFEKKFQKKKEFEFFDFNEKFSWCFLIAKALAKVYGGYEKIPVSTESELIMSMTGFNSYKITKKNFSNFPEKSKKLEILWSDIESNFSKGHIMSMSFDEKERNKMSYSLVCTASAKNQNGAIDHLLKLRTCFQNMEWKGHWNSQSPNWSEENVRKLNFNFGNKNEFWVTLEEFYDGFEELRVYETNNNDVFTSFLVQTKNDKISRKALRISIKKDGVYNFNILKSYLERGIFSSEVKFMFGSLNEGNVEIIKNYSEKNSSERICSFKANLKCGEYFILIEKRNSKEYANSKLISSQSLSLTVTGDNYVEILDVETHWNKERSAKERALFNKFLYLSLKNLAQNSKKESVSDFNLNYGGVQTFLMSVLRVDIKSHVVFCIMNRSQENLFVEAEVSFRDKVNIIGREGNNEKMQKFFLEAGKFDIFILENRFGNSKKNYDLENFQLKIFDSKILSKIDVEEMKKNELESIIHFRDLMRPNLEKRLFKSHHKEKIKIPKMGKKKNSKKAKTTLQEKIIREKINNIRKMTEKNKIKIHLPKKIDIKKFQKKARFNPKIEVLGGNKTEENKKEKKSKPILKSKNRNYELESKNVYLYHEINEEVESLDKIDERVVSKVMIMRPEDLLKTGKIELKNLLKYFGLHSFIYIYQVDFDYLTEIYKIISNGKEFNKQTSQKKERAFEKKLNFNEEKSRRLMNFKGLNRYKTPNKGKNLKGEKNKIEVNDFKAVKNSIDLCKMNSNFLLFKFFF